MHLRNTLAKGMDAESYSLHTFEALLSQSMENLGNFKAPWPSKVLIGALFLISFKKILFKIPPSWFIEKTKTLSRRIGRGFAGIDATVSLSYY